MCSSFFSPAFNLGSMSCSRVRNRNNTHDSLALLSEGCHETLQAIKFNAKDS